MPNYHNINYATIERLLKRLDEATGFFGPCWCKASIDFKCPQCIWREEYAKDLEHVTVKPKKKD